MERELEAIEKALQLERNGREFYLKAAERTGSLQGRQMFLSLAQDEELHYNLFQKQRARISADEGWATLPEIGQPAVDWDQPLFPKDAAEVRKAVHPEAGDLDALTFAIQIENEAHEFYRRMAHELNDPAAQTMYRWLAGVELGHFNQLMLNYEALINSGHWATA